MPGNITEIRTSLDEIEANLNSLRDQLDNGSVTATNYDPRILIGSIRRVVGLPRTPMNMSLKDAVMLSYVNADFCKSFIATPELYAEMFSLSNDHVNLIREIDIDEIMQKGRLIGDSGEFANAVDIIDALAKKDGGH